MQRPSDEIRRLGIEALTERLGQDDTARFLDMVGANPGDQPPASAQGAAGPQIEQVLEALAARVPKDEWDSLPPDLSDNIDHYVHGTPKK